MSGAEAVFRAAVDEVVKTEGGYSNDPLDSGGETIFGVTVAVARAFGYDGRMRAMTRDQAVAIYRERFWDANRLSDVAEVSPAIARELFDTGVNQGTAAAATYLQRALNVFNMNAAFYPDTKVDGRIGPMTVAALREFLVRRHAEGERVMLRALNALQGAFYVELAERRQTDERFVFGWLANRVT